MDWRCLRAVEGPDEDLANDLTALSFAILSPINLSALRKRVCSRFSAGVLCRKRCTRRASRI